MRVQLTRRPRDERGAVTLMVALMTVIFAVLSAFVVDLGAAYVAKHQQQTAADAAVLAGGGAVFGHDGDLPDYAAAEAAAKSYAASNTAGSRAPDWADCRDDEHLPIVLSTQCISFRSDDNDLWVRVKMPTHTLETSFGQLAGVSEIEVVAAARATIRRGGASRCGLCIVGSGLHDLQNGDAFVSGADIHLNGSVNVNNNGLVVADGAITVQGTASGPLSGYTPDPQVGQPPMKDPLRDYPDAPDMGQLFVKNNPCTQGPGIYGDYSIRDVTCTLQPGTYVIADGTWDLAGNDSTLLTGDGVTLFFTCGTPTAVRACNPGEEGGTLKNAGNGRVSITAPTTGPTAGMAFWYDRQNAATLTMTGNGSQGFTGTIYAASAHLRMNGNGCTSTLNALIVIADLEMNGNPACLRSTYMLEHNVEIPPGDLRLDQ